MEDDGSTGSMFKGAGWLKENGKSREDYVCDLIAYYRAHQQEDADWVILPVTSFDMYYGGSYFSKRILSTR